MQEKPSVNNPLVTIITVTFNDSENLEKTILNVLNQTYKNTEYIIIDGGSSDGSIDTIKKYEHRINKWISEKDKGIFDAMNKGIKLATGEWINFMNAGDTFTDSKMIQLIVDQLDNDTDFIYGGYVDNYFIGKYSYTKTYPATPLDNEFWKLGNPCHQSCFVKTKYLKNTPFITDCLVEKDKADFGSLLNFRYKQKLNFKRVDLIVSVFNGGGFSSSNIFEKPEFLSKLKSRIEDLRLITKYKNTPPVYLYYLTLIARDMILSAMLKPLPHKYRYKLFDFLKRKNLN